MVINYTNNKMKTTKRSNNYAMMLTGLTSLTLILPAAAIESPHANNEPSHNERQNKDAAAKLAPKENRNEKQLAWIGLGGAPVSEALAGHLGLEPGNGLTIFHVCPDSAAEKAGIKMHDVVTECDGKKTGDFEDLRKAVIARNPGDEVVIKFIQKGKVVERKVVLGKRTDNRHQHHDLGEPEDDPLWRGMGHLPRIERNRIEGMMKRRLKEMRKQLERNGGVEFDMKEFFDEQHGDMKLPQGIPEKLHEKFNFNAQTSITLMDDAGSVTVKKINGKREVIVKDKEGGVLFEGPYQTEQDKAAVPDDIRARLDKINMEGFRFGVLPEPDEPPQLKEDEAKPVE